MKILWFANTPCNASEFLGYNLSKGGWLSNLDLLIQKRVELHIAFYESKSIGDFKFGETTYHPLSSTSIRRNSLKNVIKPSVIFEEDLQLYLNLIDRVKPDLIHIHGTENSFITILPHVKVPVVLTIQGLVSVIEHKFSGDFDSQQLKILPNTGKSFKNRLFSESFYKRNFVFRLMAKREQKYLPYAKYIIGRTNWDRRVTRVLSPFSQYFHCDELLNPVFNECTKKYYSAERGKMVLFTTNGDSPFKGFETLCKAASLLKNNGFSFEWQVAGLSKGDTVVRMVKKLLGDQFPFDQIILLGKLDPKTLALKLSKADMYVMPSHIENSPNSLCEAMMVGLPCIATYAGGTSSLITDNIDGLLIQDGDPWSMAGTILELAKNISRANELGQAARSKALDRHDDTSIVSRQLEIYKFIIGINYANL